MDRQDIEKTFNKFILRKIIHFKKNKPYDQTLIHLFMDYIIGLTSIIKLKYDKNSRS